MHQIGVGVLGPVFRTYEPAQDRLVAVKVFQLDITPEQSRTLGAALERLLAVDLSHPGLVAPIAVGFQDEVPYLAQEYVAAESLDVAMRHYAPAPFETALPFIGRIAAAIDAAHAEGIVHGALHLRDVFVTPDEARVTGFGVVKALEELGLAGPIRRPYTAPEIIAGREWGGEADLFALAAIAYELLTGRRAAGTGEQMTGRLASMEGVADPEGLQEAFARALADDPEARYSSGARFVSALEVAVGQDFETGAADDRPGRPTVDLLAGLERPPADGGVTARGIDAFTSEVDESDLVLEDEVEEEVDATDELEEEEVEETDALEELDVVIGDDGAEAAAALDEELEEEELEEDEETGEDDELEAVDEVEEEEGLEEELEEEEDEELLATDEVEAPADEDEVDEDELEEEDELEDDDGDAVAALEDLTDDEGSVAGDLLADAPSDSASTDVRYRAFEIGDDADDEDVEMDDGTDDAEDEDLDEEQADDLFETHPGLSAREVGGRSASGGYGVSDERGGYQALPMPSGPAMRERATGFTGETPPWAGRVIPLAVLGVAVAILAYLVGLGLGSDPDQPPTDAVLVDAEPETGAEAPPFEPADSPPPRIVPETRRDAALDRDVAAPSATPPTIEDGRATMGSPLDRLGRVERDEIEEATEPTPAPEEAVAAATAAAAAAPVTEAPAMGWLLVRTEPAGALVVVDGVDRGITPITLSDIPFGEHQVEIVREGFGVHREQVVVDRPVNPVEVRLTPAGAAPVVEPEVVPPAPTVAAGRGSLDVASRPSGARVIVDGEIVGVTPITLPVLPGRHSVRLELDGYQVWSSGPVDVDAGETMDVRGSLERSPR